MELFKQKIKNEHIILFLLFLFVLAFRLYFAFQTNQFNTDDAYFHLRNIESLTQDKVFLFYDDLSYGGRFVLYPPFFHILMVVLSFGSLFLLKLIPEIFISLTVFIVYLIAKEISGNKYASLFSALLSAFYPILFFETLNNLSVYSLVIPILLIMIYSLLKLEENKYLWLFIICAFILPLTHPSAFVFVFTIIFYFILLAGGALTPSKLKREAVVFSILLVFLIEFIIYKKAFLEYGLGVLWQNIPATILGDMFRKMTAMELVTGVGLLPLILGSFGIYFSMVKERRKIDYIFAAFPIAILILIVFRFLALSVGLMFLGLVLCIFSAIALKNFYNYLDKLKFNRAKNLFTVLFLILFVLSSLVPSFLAARESNNLADLKVKEVKWMSINTDPETVVLGNVEEGNLISTVGHRKNVIDSSFILAPDPVSRSKDVNTIYTTVSEAIAIDLLKKYDIGLIYISSQTKDIYGIEDLKYAEKSKCFESIRGGKYYAFKC